MRSVGKGAVAGLIALVAALSVGCSRDRHEFYSTPELPTSVALTDPRTREVVWSKDIPVGHRMVVDLDREGESELTGVKANLPATRVKWKLYRTVGPDGRPDKEKIDEGQDEIRAGSLLMRVSYRESGKTSLGR